MENINEWMILQTLPLNTKLKGIQESLEYLNQEISFLISTLPDSKNSKR